MTRERAQHILSHTEYGSLRYAFKLRLSGGARADNVLHADGITEAEDAAVRAVWDTMPGTSCYHDALVRIARGVA